MSMYVSDLLPESFLNKYKTKTPPWGFNGLGYVVYKRTYARKIEGTDQTEEWWQTVARCINGAQEIGADYTSEEAQRLFDLVFNLKCNFAGRMLWQLGTETVKKFGGNSLLNCWMVAINDPKAFLFIFENLMLGGGVGFSIRREDIHELPKIKKDVTVTHLCTKDADFIVPDSRSGWVELLRKTLEAYYTTGKSFSYSTILVRGAGERITGFGGTASGPGILIEGIEKISKIFQHREGKKLRSVDVLDICNIIGSIVVAGNVRRSAQIALGDPDDYLFLRAKNWSLGSIPNWRAMSNNTIYADDFSHISNEIWTNGYIIDPETGFAKGEPYGFFNLPLSQKYGRLKDGPLKGSSLYPVNEDNVIGTNPCFHKDTRIHTHKGLIKIIDLYNEQTPFNTVIDTRYYKDSFDLNQKGTDIKKCTEVVLTQKNAQLYKVVTEHGNTLTVTDNHTFLTLTGKKQLKDLVVGEKLLLQSGKGKFGSKGSYKEGLLLGLITGDGTIYNNFARISIWEQDFDVSDEILSILTETIGEKQAGNFFNRNVAWSTIKDKYNNFYHKTISSSKLYNHIQESLQIQDPVSIKDRVPECVFQGTEKMVKGYLQGLVFTDGSVNLKCKNKGSVATLNLEISQSKKQLLEDVQVLLNNFGIISRLYTLRDYETEMPMPDGKGGIKMYKTRPQYRISLNRPNTIKFFNLIGFFGRKNKLCKDLLDERGWECKKKERYLTTIKSIEKNGIDDVYCFTQKDTNTTIANGIPVGQCGEISLASYECCNLSELYLNNITSQEELIECATLLYKTQKAIAALSFIHPDTNKIVHKNMRLGLGVTGICQGLNDKIDWLDKGYEALRKFDKIWSKKKGYPESIKLTTVKPSGSLSLLAGSTPGVHPAYSPFYIRRVRMSSNDKLVGICRELGYHVEFVRGFDGKEDHSTVVVSFPCHAGDNCVVAKSMTAVQQLDLVKKLQTYWSDNAVSVTVYYRQEELEEIKAWLEYNYETSIKSVSFLLHNEHGFAQAPYEEITEEEYQKLVEKVRPIITTNIGQGEIESMECVGGVCPIK